GPPSKPRNPSQATVVRRTIGPSARNDGAPGRATDSGCGTYSLTLVSRPATSRPRPESTKALSSIDVTASRTAHEAVSASGCAVSAARPGEAPRTRAETRMKRSPVRRTDHGDRLRDVSAWNM